MSHVISYLLSTISNKIHGDDIYSLVKMSGFCASRADQLVKLIKFTSAKTLASKFKAAFSMPTLATVVA